jgi:RHS repeat-associated protein
LETPVWDKFYYDNLRRLNQVDYATDSPFASAADNHSSVIPNPLAGEESAYQLSFLASLALQWLDDGTTTTSVIPAKLAPLVWGAGIQNLPSVSSVHSVADRLLTLAEFGSASETDPNVRTETIYDDQSNISAQIVYDANGNITLFALYPDDGSKVVIVSTYDTDGNLSSQVFTTYDADGNVISREDIPLPTETTENNIILSPSVPSVAKTSVYSQADLWLLEAELLYDGGMMLMSAPSGPFAASEEFIYDHLGNRYQYTDKDGYITTYTHNPVNQYGLISKDLNFFGFKDERYPSHDDNGNMTEDGYGNTYFYDYRNRLTEIKDVEGNSIAKYTYDALGRRIKKVVGNQTTYFFYDTQGRVIAEYKNDTLDRTYVWGNGQTEVLAMFLPQHDVGQDDWEQFLAFCVAWLSISGQAHYEDSLDVVDDNKIDYKDFAVFAAQWGTFPSNEESHYYYLTDALGSVRGLIGGKFNREDDREFYNYDVYGATTDISAAGNPVMFAGYWCDAETGLCHLKNRTYDPYTGRLLQLDPRGVNPSGGKQNPFKPFNQYKGGTNLYEYGKSSPTRYTDPEGLMPGLPPIPGYDPLGSPGSYPMKPDGGYVGGEAHFFGGFGFVAVTCRDNCGNPKKFTFVKYCLGGAIGVSVGGGFIHGLDGDRCKAENYEGWFYEAGLSYGPVGAGVDIGYDGENWGLPGCPSGVCEGGGGLGKSPGAGLQAKSTWCYYVQIGGDGYKPVTPGPIRYNPW